MASRLIRGRAGKLRRGRDLRLGFILDDFKSHNVLAIISTWRQKDPPKVCQHPLGDLQLNLLHCRCIKQCRGTENTSLEFIHKLC